jgi:hypothetical protein
MNQNPEGAEPAEMQASKRQQIAEADSAPPASELPKPELPRKHYYAPKPGMRWNPLREWPRNEQCFCGSKKKAKKCHLPSLVECVKVSEAELLDQYIADYKAGKAVEPLEQGKP